jgi:hypothetical protein
MSATDYLPEIKAHLATTVLPVEIRELVTRELQRLDPSSTEAAQLVLAALSLPTQDTARFMLRDALDADLPPEQRHDEALNAVTTLFTHGPREVA